MTPFVRALPLRAKLPWILAAVLAVAAIGWGVARSLNHGPPALTRAQAQDQLEALGGRFSVAVENERDVRPMLAATQAIAERFPDLRGAHQLRGQIRAQLGETDAAYAAFGRALELQPDDAELQNLAGTAASLIDKPVEAEAHFRRAVEQAPDEARFRIRLGDTLLKAGRLDEAEAEFTRALTLRLMAHAADAGLSDVYAARARVTDDPAERADLLRRAIEQNEIALGKLPYGEAKSEPIRTVYRRKLARHYHQRGDADQASAILENLPEADRYDPAVLAELATYLNARGQPVVAALQYELAARRDPSDPDLLVEGARWFRRAGDTDAARLLTERLAQGWPNHPAIDGLRGELNAVTP